MNSNGGIAQLGERLHGMQEVIGSIPFTSTNFLQGMFLKKAVALFKSTSRFQSRGFKAGVAKITVPFV